MKWLLACGFAVAAGQCAAGNVVSPTSDPLIGQWRLDTSRLPMPPGDRPRHVEIGWRDDGAGRLAMAVDIVYANGEQVHSKGRVPLDGTPTPVQGSPEADIAASKRPVPGVLVMVLGKAGGPGSTRVYTVAADRKSLVETVTAYAEQGRPTVTTHYFNRIR